MFLNCPLVWAAAGVAAIAATATAAVAPASCMNSLRSLDIISLLVWNPPTHCGLLSLIGAGKKEVRCSEWDACRWHLPPPSIQRSRHLRFERLLDKLHRRSCIG